MYEPEEDSHLLAKCVKKYAFGNVLDMGTGSGILAVEAARLKRVKKVVGVDIDKPSITYCKKNSKHHKITYKYSNLFSNVKERFDTIIFNPPYLPGGHEKDLSGGKHGYEIVEKFLKDVNLHLANKGVLLLLFSSLTHKDKVEEFLQKNLLKFKQVAKEHVFFEDLYVYLIEKDDLLKQFETKGIEGVSFLAKGKRGIVLKGKYNGKDVAVKYTNPKSKAINRIQNETNWLRRVHKKKIGPGVHFASAAYVVSSFIDGEKILDFLEQHKNVVNKAVLRDLFTQCFEMDKMKMDKEEMHHPVKHVIVRKLKKGKRYSYKPVLIDFERSRISLKPKNVTQLCQFVTSLPVTSRIKWKIDKRKVLELAQEYKKNINKKHLLAIIKACT